MRELEFFEAHEVSGAGDVSIDYFVSLDDEEDGRKSMSVFLKFTGDAEEDLIMAIDSLFF